ncbi:MAG: glycosyltransferase family 2 protein, partial [Fervidobacterium sp.]
FFSRKVVFCEKATSLAVYRKDSSTKVASMKVFHNVASMKRLRRFLALNNCELDLLEIFDSQIIPSSYAWVIGNLAFNGYPYKEWTKIIKNKKIWDQVRKFKVLTKETPYYRRVKLAKSLFFLSPFLFYITMRIIKKQYDKNSEE